MEKLKKVGSELIYDGIRVHLYKEKIQMPTGKIAEWELIKHPGAAAVIPVTDEGKIIMVRQYRNAADDYTLEIPAGCFDEPFEDPKACALRELEEETGQWASELDFLFKFYSSIGICDEVIHVFVARNLTLRNQKLDEDEYVELEQYSVDELIRMIFNGEIVDSKTISSILMYKEKYKI